MTMYDAKRITVQKLRRIFNKIILRNTCAKEKEDQEVIMDQSKEEAVKLLYDAAEKNGMAAGGTTDGYVFMFKRERLMSLLLSDTSPAVRIGVQSPGGTKSVQLSRNILQGELDAHPEAPMLLVVYTHEPVKN